MKSSSAEPSGQVSNYRTKPRERETSGPIVLEREESRLALNTIGAAVEAWSVMGQDILRPGPASIQGSLEAACFPLVPYCNRIANGMFHFAGRGHALTRNYGDHPHSLHGIGWQSDWHIAEHNDHNITLSLRTNDSGWPWPFTSILRFELLPTALGISIELTNRSEQAMPAGIGLHPYILAGPGALFEYEGEGLWETDENQLPTGFNPDLSALPAPTDHCIAGWTGEAVVQDGGRKAKITATPIFDHLHIYRPADADFVCLEPVSHAPDALNGTGPAMRLLDPGEILQGSMRIEVL